MSTLSVLDTQTIIPTSQVQRGESSEERAAADAEQQKVDFLNILLTQLENQNPLDPMDTDEYTAQLTRYSILEQGIETNEKLAITNDLLKASSASTNLAYIGEQVEFSSNIGVAQNGGASWNYAVEGVVDKVDLTVTDEDGNSLYEVEGSISGGVHNLTIDTAALGIEEGQQLYLSVAARDKKGGQLNTQITTNAVVDGVWTDNNQSYLTAGDISFRASDVLKLIEVKDTTPPSI